MRRKILRLVGGNPLTSVFFTFNIIFRLVFFIFLIHNSVCFWAQVLFPAAVLNSSCKFSVDFGHIRVVAWHERVFRDST